MNIYIAISGMILTFIGGSLSASIFQGLKTKRGFSRDSKTVYKYLESLKPGNLEWFSTKNIASATNLTPTRVEEVCAKHPKIKMSTGKKDGMWGLRKIST